MNFEDDDEDDGPEEEMNFEGMWWEDEKTFRTQEIEQMPKMIELSSGKTLCGLVVNETSQYLEIKWPCVVMYFPVQIQGQIVTGIQLLRYAPGVHEEFITLNKDQLVWWNDTEADTDQFYFNRIRELYQSAKMYFSRMEHELNYPAVDDQTIESKVTALTTGKIFNSVTEMLQNIEGYEPEAVASVTERSEVTKPKDDSNGLEEA